MTTSLDSRRLVDKLWSYCDVLRDDGVGLIECTKPLTCLLFLKMAHERDTRKLHAGHIVPDAYSWQRLLEAHGDQLELENTRNLTGLGASETILATVDLCSQRPGQFVGGDQIRAVTGRPQAGQRGGFGITLKHKFGRSNSPSSVNYGHGDTMHQSYSVDESIAEMWRQVSVLAGDAPNRGEQAGTASITSGDAS